MEYFKSGKKLSKNCLIPGKCEDGQDVDEVQHRMGDMSRFYWDILGDNPSEPGDKPPLSVITTPIISL